MAIVNGNCRIRMHDDSLQRVLAQWQAWGLSEPATLIDRLPGGLNNSAYLIGSGQQQLVLKLFSEASAQAGLAQSLAAQNQLAPSIIYLDVRAEYCLMHYLPAQQQARLPAIAHSLAKLHELPSSAMPEFEYRRACNDYLSALSDDYQHWHAKLAVALDYFVQDPIQHCVCHNDLVADNILQQQQRALFIDWEYAALNNPCFDVVAVCFYFDLNDSQRGQFLADYTQLRDVELRSASLAAALCAVIWIDILWHAARGVRLEIALDYEAERAKFKHLQTALACFNDS